MGNADVQLPPDRKFGIFIAAVLAALGGWLAYKGAAPGATAAFAAGLAALVLALALPRALRPFNRAWMALGLVLGKVMGPVIFGLIFFGLITPIALVTRAFGRDELRLRRRPAASYWRHRAAPRIAPQSFATQY